MKTKVIIHPNELNKQWIDNAIKNNIDIIGIHSEGNIKAHLNLLNDMQLFNSEEYKQNIDYAIQNGIQIEYELHAISYLLPRELFERHPEYFRMDENGERRVEINCCVSSEQALEIIASNAVELVKKLYGSSNNYFLWTDDIKGNYCKCEKCKNLSASDQNLIIMNAIIRKLRQSIPDARIAYLAYYDSLNVPKVVKPENGVFLEYAPYERDLYKPASIMSGEEVDKIKALIEFFGKKNSCVLEYWLDNSYFSDYKKPPKKLTVNNEEIKNDIKFYLNLGFENVSTFACFLGPDYVELFGEPDISAFKK